MTDREALLAAVRESPDDDLPRLVFADWLDDRGESERAAFIRAQVEAAREEPDSPAARDAEDRAAALLTDAHSDEWTQGIRGLILEAGFERSFVHHATVDAAQFPENARELFTLEAIRSLRVCRPAPSRSEFEILLRLVFEVPELEHLTALDLQGIELVHADLMDLAECDTLTGLERLSLRGNPIPPNWLEEMLDGGNWSELRHLNLSDIPHLGPTLARCLPRLDDDHRFESLDFSGIAFRSNELKRLLESDCVSQLEELHLRWHGGPDRPGSLTHLELSYVIPWERLRVLDVEGQGLGPEGVREIVRNSHASSLRRLGLARNYIGADAVSLLCEDADIHLYHLDVRFNDLRPRDLARLAARFPEARIVS
jgi:uncharacterized protein (TIGR02996 family)